MPIIIDMVIVFVYRVCGYNHNHNYERMFIHKIIYNISEYVDNVLSFARSLTN